MAATQRPRMTVKERQRMLLNCRQASARIAARQQPGTPPNGSQTAASDAPEWRPGVCQGRFRIAVQQWPMKLSNCDLAVIRGAPECGPSSGQRRSRMATKLCQELTGATRSNQELPGATKSNNKPPRTNNVTTSQQFEMSPCCTFANGVQAFAWDAPELQPGSG